MEQNEQGKVSPWLLVTLIVVILVAAGFFGWYFWNQSQPAPAPVDTFVPVVRTASSTPTISLSISPSISPSTSSSPTSVADWKTYMDKTYGFSLVFPNDNWKNYKVIAFTPTDGTAVKYLYFAVPTTDANWNESNVGKGYASQLAVTVYTPAQWKEALGGPQVEIAAGQNTKYIFTISQSQASPTDLTNVDFGTKSVENSFKAIQ